MEPAANTSISRRDFVKTAAAAAFAAAVPARFPVFAAGSDAIRVGVIGCGGRGTGAAIDCLTAAPVWRSSPSATSCQTASNRPSHG